MAIFHYTVKIVGRSKGKSVISASAYLNGKYVIICTLPLKKTCRPSGGTFYFFFLVRNPSGNSFDHGKSRFRSSGFGKGPILRSSSNT